MNFSSEEREWFKLRDLLVEGGHVEEFLKLASECKHPDCQWLLPILKQDNPEKRVLSVEGQTPRAIFYHALLSRHFYHEKLRKIAEEDVRYSAVYCHYNYNLSFGFALRAAHIDPLAAVSLAECYYYGIKGCENKNCNAAFRILKPLLSWYPRAMKVYATLAFDNGLERYQLYTKCAKHGGAYLLNMNVEPLLKDARSCFEIGRLRCKYSANLLMNNERKSHCSALYWKAVKSARSSINCWSIIARRLGVVKDIRVLISKLVWKDAWFFGTAE